ncbi:MAG: efflux transporter outer rane subunit, partial [Verrucomicrobia bacterium]|nr:efflux transporter outer rane subunit [Verrucomicrobiota bacterium]
MKISAPLAAFALIALGWAGCNVAPDYQAPETAGSVSFKEAVTLDIKPDGGWKLASPSDEQLRGPWWELYGDPILNRLEETVTNANQNVSAAEARYRQARALEAAARGGLWPTIGVTPSVTRSRSSSVSSATASQSGATTRTSSSGTRTVYTLPFDTSYEFDLWHRVRNTIAENSDNAQAAAADLANVLLSA